jgi:diadenosine tetraphosphatase ApaH/serine/threonine PP2A family protein phosphatase
MRCAILSDIHANLEALSAVLERIPAEDALLCLGDTVGYGPNPNECVALIRERATAAVLGNHDVGAIDNHGLAYFNPAARRAIEWTQTMLSAENAAWLDSLSYEFRTPEYLLVHGAPVEYFTYILDMATARDAFAATDAPLIFVGHTHIADYYALVAGDSLQHQFMQHGGRLELADGVRYLVNAGSVGQPRDLNPEASFCFFDPVARDVEWVRVPYPFGRTQEKIEAAGLPVALARRLAAGR